MRGSNYSERAWGVHFYSSLVCCAATLWRNSWLCRTPYLDKAGVLKDFIRVSNQFELLHNCNWFVQVQNHSCGSDAEIGLRGNKIGWVQEKREAFHLAVVVGVGTRTEAVTQAAPALCSHHMLVSYLNTSDRLHSQEACTLGCYRPCTRVERKSGVCMRWQEGETRNRVELHN